MTPDIEGCDLLDQVPDAELYEKRTAIVKVPGFNFVDAWYYELVGHSPIFLYFASSLTMCVYTYPAMFGYSTSKGILTGDEIPDDTTMASRKEIWARTEKATPEDERLSWTEEQAKVLLARRGVWRLGRLHQS